MIIPDLFGAYIKGREYAIEKNWQDLKNYEDIERARNSNDLQALDILRQRAKFGGEMDIFQNKVNQSNRGDEIQNAAQPGLLAQTLTGSDLAQRQHSVYNALAPQVQEMLSAQLMAMIKSKLAAAQQDLGSSGAWLAQDKNGNTAAMQYGADTVNVLRDKQKADLYNAGNLLPNARLNQNAFEENHRLDNVKRNAATQQIQSQIPLIAPTAQYQALQIQDAVRQLEGRDAAMQATQAQEAVAQSEALYARLHELAVQYQQEANPATLAEMQRIAGLLNVSPEWLKALATGQVATQPADVQSAAPAKTNATADKAAGKTTTPANLVPGWYEKQVKHAIQNAPPPISKNYVPTLGGF